MTTLRKSAHGAAVAAFTGAGIVTGAATGCAESIIVQAVPDLASEGLAFILGLNSDAIYAPELFSLFL